MAESQDVNTLRRRGRRRLVGAIALVLLAAIVLPMVFDPEPKPGAPPVSVRIPGEDDASFAPKATSRAQTPQMTPAPAPLEPSRQTGTPVEKPASAAPVAEAAAVRQAEEKPAAAAPEAARATVQPAAPAAEPAAAASAVATEQFVVPVAALASQAKVKELLAKLKAAQLPYYTEPLATAKGTVMRIRVGPYATREAADEAQRQLTRLGLNPGKVLAKS